MTDQTQPKPIDYFTSGYSASNAGYYATGALQIRLDTKSIIDEFENYLKGKIEVQSQDKTGKIFTQIIKRGHPMVNDIGFQSIMQTLNMIINNQVVQGNFIEPEDYERYLCRARKDLAMDLMINKKRYDLEIKDYSGLMMKFMRIIELFMTRPIHNKERDSYSATMKTLESVQTKPTQGFSFMGIGGK